MKMFSALFLILIYVAILSSGWEKERCVDGVVYFDKWGMHPKYLPDGKIATCPISTPKTPQQMNGVGGGGRM